MLCAVITKIDNNQYGHVQVSPLPRCETVVDMRSAARLAAVAAVVGVIAGA